VKATQKATRGENGAEWPLRRTAGLNPVPLVVTLTIRTSLGSATGSDRFASDVDPLVHDIVHAALAYIVTRRDHVLIFASPMSEPDINSVIEREFVCH
jgi:hypothetical protein